MKIGSTGEGGDQEMGIMGDVVRGRRGERKTGEPDVLERGVARSPFSTPNIDRRIMNDIYCDIYQ
jgi:hypothetical protein